MPSVPVGDARVAYEVVGEGEPIVLLHPTTSSRSAFAFLTPALADRYTVVLVDYGGSGETVDNGGRLELEDLAAQVAGVCDELGLPRVNLLGWSLGAEVVARLTVDRPDLVRTLTMVHGWACSDARFRLLTQVWQRMFAVDREALARLLLTDMSPLMLAAVEPAMDDVVAQFLAGMAPGSDRQAELDGRIDLRDVLPTIAVPTLVVGGLRDAIVPVEHSREIAALVPDAQLVEFDCGHYVPTEKVSELVDLVDKLIAGAP